MASSYILQYVESSADPTERSQELTSVEQLYTETETVATDEDIESDRLPHSLPRIT